MVYVDQFQNFVAIRQANDEKGEQTCDLCWQGCGAGYTVEEHYDQEMDARAPGLEVMKDQTGDWNGAMICKDCVKLCLQAFELLGARCPDCFEVWDQTHSRTDEECDWSNHRPTSKDNEHACTQNCPASRYGDDWIELVYLLTRWRGNKVTRLNVPGVLVAKKS